jgi:hypothetical protein
MNKTVKTVWILSALACALSFSSLGVGQSFAQVPGQDPGALIGNDPAGPRNAPGNNSGPGGAQGDPDTWQIDVWHGDIVRVDRPETLPIERPWEDVASLILALMLRITLFSIW